MASTAQSPLLTASALRKTFGGVVALSDFGLSLVDGDLLGLIGPNGAGKTTAFNLLTGVLKPSGGEVRIQDRVITRLSPEARSKLGLSRTFQNIRLFDELTVLQNVMAGAHAKHGTGLARAVLGLPGARASEASIRALAERALESTGLEALANRRADALSYGDRRRVEIARALAAEPKVLLLDEPAAGMNQGEKTSLSELIRRLNQNEGLTIVLVEHNVPMVAALCRRVVVLDKGEVLTHGLTGEVLADPKVIDVYLGRRRSDTQGARHAEA